MAEGCRDQGGVGTTDPEEDSPNMIVYRKVSFAVCVCMKLEAFPCETMTVDGLLTAHWSVSVCVCDTCQEASL